MNFISRIEPVVDLNYLYAEMLYIRMLEEEIAARYHDQEMRCPVHLSIGQEAVPVGISATLRPEDHVVSAHRSHAHYLARGGDLRAMLAEIHGKEAGCAGGRGGSMHLIDLDVNVTAAVPIVGSSISIGTGVAFGLQIQQKQGRVVVYFGDGATEEGAFAESLDFAALHDLQVLFVCENNMYSVYSKLSERQCQDRSLQKIVEGHGIKYFSADGNDVLACYDVAQKAFSSMLQSKKPAFLELPTYRWLEHCGPNWDDDLGYRPEGELKEWMERCPLLAAEKCLKTLGEWDEEDINLKKQQIRRKISDAFDFARAAPFPDVSTLQSNVYANEV